MIPRFPKGTIATTDQAAAAKLIASANPNFQGRVNIVRAAWTGRAQNDQRAHGPLIIGVETGAQANFVVSEGIRWRGELLDAEIWCAEAHSSRCFNCQMYGNHIAKRCKAPTRCGNCAAVGHAMTECPVNANHSKRACAPCGGILGHNAFSPNCPAKLRAAANARERFAARPSRFETRAGETPRAPATLPRSSQTSVTTVSNPDEILLSDSEDYETVVRKRRGRPVGSASASRQTGQTKLNFAPIPMECEDSPDTTIAQEDAAGPRPSELMAVPASAPTYSQWD